MNIRQWYFLSLFFTTFLLNIAVAKACTSINNVADLYKKIEQLNNSMQPGEICLEEGYYHLTKTLQIIAPNITIRSKSNKPETTILHGNGMKISSKVNNLIHVQASYFSLSGVTLEQVGSHLIQIAGELGISHFTLKNSILRDSYEQLFKVSKGNNIDLSAKQGLITDCIFEYTQGIGPNWYIGGIDIHNGENWKIVNNAFFNISSPSQHIAEHAIHLWSTSKNAIIKNNFIINSDRGIGLGLGKSKHFGGIVANNFIYHNQPENPYADTGIVLESSSNVSVFNNTIWLKTQYPNAIEIRFESDKHNVVNNNLSNKIIRIKDKGNATFKHNRAINNSDLELKKILHGFLKRHPLEDQIISRLKHNPDFN